MLPVCLYDSTHNEAFHSVPCQVNFLGWPANRQSGGVKPVPLWLPYDVHNWTTVPHQCLELAQLTRQSHVDRIQLSLWQCRVTVVLHHLRVIAPSMYRSRAPALGKCRSYDHEFITAYLWYARLELLQFPDHHTSCWNVALLANENVPFDIGRALRVPTIVDRPKQVTSPSQT
jgi:hypothetical protein